ncbi:gas vesicle protein GvpG [Halocatena marina]|uniref:Gas vesicle protein GvpG n=1 Tax=Halocatena marina TaxID=2934937 RepID=A0ABD5YSS9_9EURY|nr:protein gvpG [Halocatena marina]
MTFIIDDLLFRPFVTLADIIRSTAIDELYDIDEIQDDIKENRLLYEIGERSREEYDQRRVELERQLDVAEQARKTISGKVKVKQ